MTRDEIIAVLKKRGLTDEQIQAATIDPTMGDKATNAAMGTLSTVGKVFDYVPGISRTALQGVADLARGTDQGGSIEEALSAEAQPWAKYLEKAGAPEMGSVDVPLPDSLKDKLGRELRLTGRDAVGMGMDILSDPVVATSLLAAPVTGGASLLAGAGIKGLQSVPKLMAYLQHLSQVATPFGMLEKVASSGPVLSKLAEESAAKSMTAGRFPIKKMGMDKFRDVGRFALDEGIISPLASSEEKLNRINDILSRSGEDIGQVYERLGKYGNYYDPTVASSRVEQAVSGFNKDAPFNQGKTNLLGKIKATFDLRTPPGKAGVFENDFIQAHGKGAPEQMGMKVPEKTTFYPDPDASRQMDLGFPEPIITHEITAPAAIHPNEKVAPFDYHVQEALPFSSTGQVSKNLPFSEARAIQDELGVPANWGKGAKQTVFNPLTENEIMARKAAMTNREYINEIAAKAASEQGDPALADLLRSANKKYHLAKESEKLASGKLAQETGNRMVGLTDYGSAAVAGLPGFAGKKILDKYGRNNYALLLDFLGKQKPLNSSTLQSVGSRMKEFSPEVLSKLLTPSEGEQQ